MVPSESFKLVARISPPVAAGKEGVVLEEVDLRTLLEVLHRCRNAAETSFSPRVFSASAGSG